MKKCCRCRIKKDDLEFHKKSGTNKLCSECIECHRKYVREHYAKNKKYYIDKAQIRNKKIKKWFSDYKSKLKCEMCGESHPATFDFHHIDPLKKDKCVSILVLSGNLTRLKKELLKCKVFCANCHRKFHWNEKNI